MRDLPCGGFRVFLDIEIRRIECVQCGTVRQESLSFRADNGSYTRRFAFYVGRRCRASTIKDIAEELHLDRHTVKDLEKQYMRGQLRRAGTPAPKVIGVDEISIKKRHTYRIVVSDLVRKRPIWFGGQDRSEASMDEFFKWLGAKKSAGTRMVVMDMWKPFRNSTKSHAPQASILFDKFHVLRHLGEALDTVRKSEYSRLSGKDRRFIKGQKYTLLSGRENLTLEGRQSLKLLLAANRRLNTAYILKESFGQLWDYRSWRMCPCKSLVFPPWPRGGAPCSSTGPSSRVRATWTSRRSSSARQSPRAASAHPRLSTSIRVQSLLRPRDSSEVWRQNSSPPPPSWRGAPSRSTRRSGRRRHRAGRSAPVRATAGPDDRAAPAPRLARRARPRRRSGTRPGTHR